MRLELATFPVKDVRIGRHTRFEDGVLEIEKTEPIALVLQDPKIASADLEFAFPGERTRIVRVRDVVEPRIKVSGPGCVFPGILGPVVTVGDGRTNRLSGTTVMASVDYTPTVPGGSGAQSSGIVDMWGPGARVTPFGSTINIIPVLKLVDGVTELEAHTSIQMAELKIAQYLAQTTLSQTPEKIDPYELIEVDPSLPRVVYILTCMTEWQLPHSRVAYYGLSIRESLPTLIHPNELFDGVLTTDTRQGAGNLKTTWSWQNLPIVHELYKRHGEELNFIGVILQRTRFETEFGKQVSAACTSQMARMLGAKGAVLTRIITSGNNFMDLMLTVQACEKKGIKTVLVTPEWGGKSGDDLPLVFYVPEADAMVSTGSFERDITLPRPERVIGLGRDDQVRLFAGDPPLSPREEITLPGWYCLTGGCDWYGYLNLTCVEY